MWGKGTQSGAYSKIGTVFGKKHLNLQDRRQKPRNQRISQRFYQHDFDALPIVSQRFDRESNANPHKLICVILLFSP
jgi:hypothetical protein